VQGAPESGQFLQPGWDPGSDAPREDGLDHMRTAISQGVDHADRE
jgi:hypothetical protein